MREALLGLLADQVQHDRDVVGAEAPQRVLVGSQLAEVEAVAVDVVELARARRRRSAPSGGRPRGGTRAGGRPSGSAGLLGRRDGALGVGRGRGERLLDEAVLARLGTATASSAWVGTGVASTTASSSGSPSSSASSPSCARPGRPAPSRSRARLGGVAQPAQLAAGDRGEVAGEVRAPVAEPDDADPHRPRRRSRAHSGPDRLHAALGGVAVAVQRRALARRRCARAPRARRRRRGRRACSSRPRTVSTHSVFARSVTQGTPARYASFWTPPESVSDRAGLAEQRAELDVAERLGQRAARRSARARSSSPASCRRARVRGCSGNSTGAGSARISSTSARRRSGSSTLPARWAVSSR